MLSGDLAEICGIRTTDFEDQTPVVGPADALLEEIGPSAAMRKWLRVRLNRLGVTNAQITEYEIRELLELVGIVAAGDRPGRGHGINDR